MLNSIDYGRSGLPMEMLPGVDPAEFHKQIESARQSQQPPPKPAPTFTGSPTQIASAITNQFIWGQHQAPLPSDGLQQVVDGLSAAVADPNAMTQKMIGLAEAMLRNGPGGGTDGIILDYTAAKLALEVAEQPDSQKRGLSERVTMPDNGQDTYNVVITPGAPGGIGNGYAVLFKKEHGTFLSQVMGAVDNIVTPIVDVATFFQPELAPLAIGLNVAQGAQDLANGNDLGGALALAGALGGGLSQLGKAGEIASSIGNDGSIIADAAGTGQGISGAIQASQQGNIVAAIASALGGAGNAFAGVDGYLLDQSNTLATPVTNELRLLSRGALTGSALAGVVTAVQGGNVAAALAALTTAAGNAGITPNELLRALLSGGGTAASVNTAIKLAQAEDSENSDAFGLPLNQISQEQITSEYYNLQAKLAAIDPSNPLAAPDLAAPGWQPSANDLAKLQGALEAYAAAPGQSLLPQVQLPNMGGNLVDPALVDQLVANGVKVTPGNVVATGTTPSGQIVFLETGSSNAGLQHIIDAHGTDFTNIGVSEDEIPSVVMHAVTEGNIVGYQGTGPGRPIYQIQINGQPQNIAVTVGFNGFIVGANPAGKMP